MLNYDLPHAPDNHRWFIREGQYDRAKRYLHLEKKVTKRRLFKRVEKWESVRDAYISSYRINDCGMARATRQTAHDIMQDIHVNFHLPTGEVV